MRKRTAAFILVIACSAASGVIIAQCRRGDGAIARLTEIRAGSASRSAPGGWKPAAAGDRFGDGDALRTSADGEAIVTFGGGKRLRMGPSTTIRFGDALSIVGEISNDSPKELLLVLEEGTARIGPRSRVRFSLGDSGRKQITLVIGEATFQAPGGVEEPMVKNVVLVVAESTVIRLVDAAPEIVDAAPPAGAAGPGETVKAQVSGRVEVTEPGASARMLATGVHEIPIGSTLSVPRRSSVELSRGGETAVIEGPAEAVIATGDALVDARAGDLSIEATDADASIAVPGGVVIARGPRSRAEIAVGRRKTRITPRAGRIEVVGAGARETIQIGESIQLSRQGAIEVSGRQPGYADFAIVAGESASIHDPGAPTAIRFRFPGKCPEGGIIAAGRGRTRRLARGDESSILLFGPGRYRYALRCLEEGEPGERVASGRLRVDRQSGTRPLPLKPAQNAVDADGLSYRIKYQNLVPHITFRWPDAPAGRYTLKIKPERGGARSLATRGPSHTVDSGQLSEGTYRFWFEGNGRRSKEGVIIIAFDNASTSGYLRAPRIAERWNDARVEVAGAGIKGSRVSVAGSRLPLDRQHRFSSKVSRPSGHAALAVRFSHPLRGVHYYIRRDGKR